MVPVTVVRRLSVLAFTTVLTAGLLIGSGAALAAPTDPPAPPTAPPESVADPESSASAEAQATGQPVVVESSTSEFSLVTALPDGTMQAEISATPVRVEQESEWVPVDASLAMASGAVRPVATALPIEFSAGGAGPLARVRAESGDWLDMSWGHGALPVPALDGSRATYADVFPGVDLVLTATAAGFSEVLVVESAAAATNPALGSVQFGLDAGALTAEPALGESMELVGVDGERQLHVGSPMWWDSASAGADAGGPGVTGTPRPAVASVALDAVTLDVVAAAETPGVVFPLYVDPDVTGTQEAWSYVDSAYPDQPYFNGDSSPDYLAHVGYVNAAWSDDGVPHTARSFFQMPTSMLIGKHVLAAHFNINAVHASSCESRAYRLWVGSAFDTSTTWNNQPWMAYHQGDQELAGGHPTLCPGAWPVGFNALDGATRATAGWTSMFFGLFALDESDPYAWKKFDVPSARLIVSYNSYPLAPQGRSVSPCLFVCSGVAPNQWFTNSNRPWITGNAVDPDGGNLSYNFQIWAGSSANPTTMVQAGWVAGSSGGTSKWQPPSALPDGVYEYRVIAWDGVDYSPWSSNWVVFVVDTVAPAAPTVTVSGAGLTDETRTGTIGKPLTATFQSSAADGVQQYVYSWWSPLPTFQTALPCNGASGGVNTACPASAGASVSVIGAAVDLDGFLFVQALDKSGNASTTTGPRLYVNPDSAGMEAGHSWPGLSSSPVTDTAPTGGQPLGLGVGITWQTEQPAPDLAAVPVMAYDGSTSAYGQTSSAVLDTTKSFTVGAWVKPAASSDIQIVMSQHASTANGPEPSFQLYQYGGRWYWCVPTAGATPTWADCAITAPDPTVTNRWTHVLGVWDTTNKQIRIYLDGSATPAATTAHSTAGQPSSGPLLVGRSNWRATGSYHFHGSIHDPFAVPGVPHALQIWNIRKTVPPHQA